MDQPGKVANPARGQLNRENGHFPVPVRAGEFGLARQVRPSRPVPSRVSLLIFHTQADLVLLTRFLPISTAVSICSFITTIRHRVSPELIGSRNCVSMAFTAESPPAQGQ